MTGCAAFGCTNTSDKYKLYSLPSGKNDRERRNIWIARINRQGRLPNTPRLCEVHFEPSQFEKNTPGKLKPNAVPSIFVHCAETRHSEPPRKKQMIDLLDSDLSTPAMSTDHTYVTNTAPSHFSESPQNTASSGNTPEYITPDLVTPDLTTPDLVTTDLRTPDHITSDHIAPILIKPEFVTSPSNNAILESSLPPTLEEMAALKRSIQLLQKKLRKVEAEKNELEINYKKLFNADQVDFLKQPSRKTTWSEDTINKALQLRISCGSNGYNMLLSQGYPLPSARTLRRKLQQEGFSNEV